jgi:hypothetical protein
MEHYVKLHKNREYKKHRIIKIEKARRLGGGLTGG